jgi:predicted dehydrogenase
MISRRKFVNNAALTTAGVAIGATAKSYAQIMGANDRVNFAIHGLNGRGYAHLSAIKNNGNKAHITHVCDVDAKILDKFMGQATQELGYTPTPETDFRHVLASKDVDAITVATPDHWHAPMAIRGLQAGKHVYVEKPSSHNPEEGEMLIAVRDKTKLLVQVGDQQRSAPHTIDMIAKIHSGSIIGKAYFGKAWYNATRKSIGYGTEVPVPPNLNWDIWQGPAPRRPYRSNVHPYNWHWFRIYGTGEALNNGTHEVDIARWALNVDYPNRVTASGGRYAYKDDWQFPDTMVTSFEYDNALLSWDGMSCSGVGLYGRDRGVAIHGETGTVVIDRGGYDVYDQKNKITDTFRVKGAVNDSGDRISRDSMTDVHFGNFIAGIRTGEKLHSPIEIANVSVTILQLSNIAWEVNRELKLDPTNGKILHDPEAMKGWGREYEKGWAPTV